MSDAVAVDSATSLAAAEGERRAVLLRTYTDAIIKAQTSHDAFDWIAAGSAFWRYARAATGTQAQVPPFNNPFGTEQPR